MNLFGTAYDRFVSQRRARILARSLARLMPNDIDVLDVGCGDG
jgi:hypothetical protein